MNRQLPPGCRLHAPSWDPRHADALAREVAIHRLPISRAPGPWPEGRPIWGRERFCHRRSASGLLAYSTDLRGRMVRGWFSNPADHAAYAINGSGTFGPITCPIEAVALELLAPGWLVSPDIWPLVRNAVGPATARHYPEWSQTVSDSTAGHNLFITKQLPATVTVDSIHDELMEATVREMPHLVDSEELEAIDNKSNSNYEEPLASAQRKRWLNSIDFNPVGPFCYLSCRYFRAALIR